MVDQVKNLSLKCIGVLCGVLEVLGKDVRNVYLKIPEFRAGFVDVVKTWPRYIFLLKNLLHGQFENFSIVLIPLLQRPFKPDFCWHL